LLVNKCGGKPFDIVYNSQIFGLFVNTKPLAANKLATLAFYTSSKDKHGFL